MRLASVGVVAWLLVAFGSSPVVAHGELTLELGAERIQPGGSIEVRGDLGNGEAFDVSLIAKADGSRRMIATIPAIEEGHFQAFVTIPADVAVGDYLVEVAVGVSVVRAPLTVAGSPVDGGDGAGPEQEEGLLQPLPSGFGTGAGVVAPSARPADSSAAGNQGGRASIGGVAVLAVAVIAAVGILAGIGAGARARRSTPGDSERD